MHQQKGDTEGKTEKDLVRQRNRTQYWNIDILYSTIIYQNVQNNEISRLEKLMFLMKWWGLGLSIYFVKFPSWSVTNVVSES